MRWLAAALVLSGCSSVEYVQYENVPRETDVVEGQTHYGEVLERFGAPILLANAPGGFAMLYERIVIVDDATGLKLGGAGYFGTTRGERDYRNTLLLFDDDGVLWKVLARDSKLSTGSGMKAGGSTNDLVGSKDYGAGPSPMAWGFRKLNPLPVLLNDKWGAIEVGQGGLEILDTPRDAGQHTLSKPVPMAFKNFNKK